MTYAQLKLDIANMVNRAKDKEFDAALLIRLAENHLSRAVDAPEMEDYNIFTVVGGQIALPPNCNKVLNLASSDNVDVTYVPRYYLDGFGDSDGGADVYSIQGRQILLYPTPDDGSKYSCRYKSTLTPLSDEEPTNWLLEQYYDLYFYASLIHSAPRLGEDARMIVWKTMANEIIDEVNKEARTKLAGNRLTLQPSSPVV